MARTRPAFPPDVAQALQRSEGAVSVRYTRRSSLAGPPTRDTVLMSTPHERVLAVLVLDTKLNLRFIRTGDPTEGARVVVVDASPLVGGGRHWDIALSWDAETMAVGVTARD